MPVIKLARQPDASNQAMAHLIVAAASSDHQYRLAAAAGDMVAIDELPNRADKCLYAEKQAGRNQTVVEK